jgi:hypothetical protein
MPVIECSCGMVMSVPVEGARSSCIRCGGLEFQILDRVAAVPVRQVASFHTRPGQYALPAIDFVRMPVAADHPMDCFATATR